MEFAKFRKKCQADTNRLEYNFHADKDVDNMNKNLWMVHQTVETNKKLVWATWGLAIGTLILSFISIYLQFLAKQTFYTEATLYTKPIKQ